jgi:hypothetical protein
MNQEAERRHREFLGKCRQELRSSTIFCSIEIIAISIQTFVQPFRATRSVI